MFYRLFVCISLLIFIISCSSEKEVNKFYYTPHHAHYFQYPETDSIQQILSISGSDIFTEDKPDTIKFSYEWRTQLSRLKTLKGVETKLYYLDSLGKKMMISEEVTNYLIYKDIPNRPHEIKRIHLVKNGDLCAMFNGLEDKFMYNEFLNFEFENNYFFGYYPDGIEAEIKLIWEDGEQTFNTKVVKSGSITSSVRSRPFG